MMYPPSPWLVTLQRVVLTVFVACIAAPLRADAQPDLRTFDRQIKPFLQKYCAKCHGGNTPKAKIGLDNIDPDLVNGEHFGKWEDVREAFNSGEMPPEDQPQPTDTERDVMTRWLDGEFKKALQYGSAVPRGQVRRLTRYELR